MSVMRNGDQLEGPWEEIVQLSPELAGRRVRVTLLTEQTNESRAERARKWLEQVDALKPGPPVGDKNPAGPLIEEKARKQGLRI